MKPDTAIKQQDSLLQEYLDGLLMEATEPQVNEEIVVTVAAAEPASCIENKADTKTDTEIQVTAETNVEPKTANNVNVVEDRKPLESIATKIPAPTVPDTQPSTEIVKPRVQQHDQSIRPAWAQNEFECLLFNVAGLNLAVPLVLLGGVYAVDKELTSLFGQAPWFLGLLQAEKINLRIVDTAHLIMPEKQRNLSQAGFSYAIRLGDSEWALACQKVDDAIKVMPAEVRWRSTEGARPWLAGTLKEKMCALVDVSALVTLLGSS